jgi:glycosyltransferase involved in cell wall biosynthesis
VIIPVFNAEKYLRQAILSALEQTLPPHEIIIVDDGSTDSSREIASSFGSAVICLSHEHRGLSAARNFALARSTGDWIAFLDADDYWSPDKLARQAALVEADPAIEVVYTGITKVWSNGKSCDVMARQPQWVKHRLAFENPIFPSTVMARRSLLIENPWPESLRSSEDWWLFYRLSHIAGFAAIAEPTVAYRIHPESLTSRNWKDVLHYAELVAQEIQNDFTGVHKFVLHRKVNSRLFANASLSQRDQGSPEYLRYIVKSLIAWPFCDYGPGRYKLFMKMIIQKINSWMAEPSIPPTAQLRN